jgi:hypothetical protein
MNKLLQMIPWQKIVDYISQWLSKPEVVDVAPQQITLKLVRKEFREDGIFSELQKLDGTLIAKIGEHSYSKLSKIPNGMYTCVKGMHRLEHMTEDFECFEITNVPDHTNILIHNGSYCQIDSSGCCLIGASTAIVNGTQIIVLSKITFAKFMEDMADIKSFILIVS